MYHFRVIVTLNLTFDLSLEKSCPEHIFYIIRGRNLKFGVWMHLGMTKCRVLLLGHCDLGLDS